MFSAFNQTSAFHASPESFIASRLEQNLHTRASAAANAQAGVVQASVLGRKVHIITSYILCQDLLRVSNSDDHQMVSCRDGSALEDATSSVFAYRNIIADFFPAPNLLLEEGSQHQDHKEEWVKQMHKFNRESESDIQLTARYFIGKHFKEGAELNLYDTMKKLAWDMLQGIFLSSDREDKSSPFAEVERLQEEVFQAQNDSLPGFLISSLFSSPRSKGIHTRELLQKSLLSCARTQVREGTCPFQHDNLENLTSHYLLFTSSLANKALASLLTAFLSNLFMKPGVSSLANLVMAQRGELRKTLLKSILLETERLSPPLIGVMRRAQKELMLRSSPGGKAYTVNAGDDVWLYLPGASRDLSIFENPHTFQFDRYISEDAMPTLAFGSGWKTCLGNKTIRNIALILAEELLEANVHLSGQVTAEGVRSWLGWNGYLKPAEIGRDMKQLPSQRPREPIIVRVLRDVALEETRADYRGRGHTTSQQKADHHKVKTVQIMPVNFGEHSTR